VKYLLLFCVCFICCVNAYSQQPYWQQQVNYAIEVSLNDKDHTLDAFEQLQYTNNSPDTLTYIWFHLWPNAYKNDRSAFSEQMLENGSTAFYFSNDSMKGYINRLEFKVNNAIARTEEHPQYMDVLKVWLPQPLAPGKTTTITTPFHVKLPYNFSRGGHIQQTYQITQWYPKPAVYDHKGWHEMPYLDQGEFYSEFGNYEVKITLPDNYVVAASGELQETNELNKLKTTGKQKPDQQENYIYFTKNIEKQAKKLKQPFINYTRPTSSTNKTLTYRISKAHDFAWFASKLFIVQYDTAQLTGKQVDVFTFYEPWSYNNWQQALGYAKDGLKKYSEYLGDYPYNTASVVGGSANETSGGMEYPSITLITTQEGGFSLDETIAHELGHNWFYGALASNERDHPWMDEGMNTFYQKRYTTEKYHPVMSNKGFMSKRSTIDMEGLFTETVIKLHKDQPIETVMPDFTKINSALIVYIKAAQWMKALETDLGRNKFDKAMQAYYRQWQFKHPYPEDFKQAIEKASDTSIAQRYNQLSVTGSVNPEPAYKTIKLTSFFSLRETDKYNYLSIAPIIGANTYDKLMIGGIIHNYQLPLNRFNFFAAPMYATGSKKLNVFGRASYSTFKQRSWLEVSGSIGKYTKDDFTSDKGDKYYLTIRRIVPSVKYTLYNKNLRSTQRWTFQARSFLLHEQNLLFTTISTPSGPEDEITTPSTNTVINQLKITSSDNRVLYPYEFNLTVDQGKQFIRAGFTGNYFFNYGSGKNGINTRFFAGKFFYTTSQTFMTQYETDRYHLTLTGPKGDEDYTYSGYFAGRNEFEGWKSQQIMQRDGFFKVRTDLLGEKIGKTDDWLMALNVDAGIPDKYNPLQVLPIKIPLRIFVDIGTYADAWKENPATGRFLYDAGFTIPLFKSLVNVYVPILYSKVYKDYFKSTLGDKRFWKTISFSIDIQKLQLNKLNRDIPL